MSLSVLICDDSAIARKAIAKTLPLDWDISISYAENGQLCLDAINAGKGELIFLDLNMPIMDGYQVLETIQKQSIDTLVIVISADIQPEAQKKARALGAIDFIQKPLHGKDLLKLLNKYGLYYPSDTVIRKNTDNVINLESIELREALQEVSNIAMGRAGDLLARLLNVFVLLPIPNVNTLESSELQMTLTSIANNDNVSAVTQGFISSGINGEALIIFHDSSFVDIAKLLKYEEPLTNNIEIEVMYDISNILIGAFLHGIAQQLDIRFSQGLPCVLGQHCRVEDLIQEQRTHLKKTLAIEVNYRIENYNIKCDLLLLFTEDSIKTLTHKIGYLINS